MPTTVFYDNCTRANSSSAGTASGPPTPSGPYIDVQAVGSIASNKLVLVNKTRNGASYRCPLLFPTSPIQEGKLELTFDFVSLNNTRFSAMCHSAGNDGATYLGTIGNTYFGVGTTPDIANHTGTGTSLAQVRYDTLAAGTYVLRFEWSNNATSGMDLTCSLRQTNGDLVVSSYLGSPVNLTATVTGNATGPQDAGLCGIVSYLTTINFSSITLTDNTVATALTEPTLSITSTTEAQITLAATANTSGTNPKTYQWKRQIDLNDTATNLGTNGTTQVDTPPDDRIYLYSLTTTDSKTPSAATNTVRIAAGRRPRNVYLVMLGDSNTYGVDGQENSFPYLMPALLNRLDTRTWSFASAANGIRSIVRNEGHSGWSTLNYLSLFAGNPYAIEYIINIWKTHIAANDPNAMVVVSIMIGGNDMGSGRTAAEYKASLADIITRITSNTTPLGDHWRVLLNNKLFAATAGRPNLTPSYFEADRELVAQFPDTVIAGDMAGTAYAVTGRNWPAWYLDLIHLNETGRIAYAEYMTQVVHDKVLYPSAVSSGGGSIEIGTAGAVPNEILGGKTTTILLSKSDAAWTPGTPGLPSFSASRGTITDQVVLTSGNAAVTLKAPDDSRPLTISAAGGFSATVQVVDGSPPRTVAGGSVFSMAARESRQLAVDFASSVSASVGLIAASASATDASALASTYCVTSGTRALVRVRGGSASGTVVTVTGTLSDGSTATRTFTLNRAA